MGNRSPICYDLHMANLIEHKKARLEYELLEIFEAGIELVGTEVKSLRARRGVLDGAHVIIRGNEAYLLNATIPAYQPKNTAADFDPVRTRRLLLTKKEIRALDRARHEGGLTIVPLALYSKGRKIKVSIALARGKKKSDKRETLKRRAAEREIAREYNAR